MLTLAQPPNHAPAQVSSSFACPHPATLGLEPRRPPIRHVQAPAPGTGHAFGRVPIYPPAAGATRPHQAPDHAEDADGRDAAPGPGPITPLLEPQVQRCSCGGACAECRAEQAGEDEARLQTKRDPAGDAGDLSVPPIVHEVLRAPGQPLDPAARALMERRFGHDFGQVRVHTDARAGDSARAVRALAYTAGRHLVFGAGQYAPATEAGRRLLAHELTHALQQGLAPDPRPRLIGESGARWPP